MTINSKLHIRPGTKYQMMPDMEPAAFEAFKADIAQRGVVVPIDVDEDGNILDGHHRHRAWVELQKNEPPPTIVREGFSEQEKRAFARKNNILRRHLTREQVRRLIAEQLKDSPDWADNRIAEELGVDHKTVGSVRDGLEATWEIPKLDSLVGKDGKARPRKQPRKRPASAASAVDEDDDREAGRTFTVAVRAAESLGGVGHANDLPDDVKLALFAAGVSSGSVTVINGYGHTDSTREWMKLEAPEELAAHERCADFMAGPGGLAELGKTDPERATCISEHHDWMIRNGWAVEEWFGEEGERWRAQFKKTERGGTYFKSMKKKDRKALVRKMIDAGVFRPPASAQ